jgi:hypothetical protein
VSARTAKIAGATTAPMKATTIIRSTMVSLSDCAAVLNVLGGSSYWDNGLNLKKAEYNLDPVGPGISVMDL